MGSYSPLLILVILCDGRKSAAVVVFYVAVVFYKHIYIFYFMCHLYTVTHDIYHFCITKIN